MKQHKRPYQSKYFVPVTIAAAVLMTVLAVASIGQIKQTEKSAEALLTIIEKRVSQTYVNLATTKGQWVAQMGGGVPLQASSVRFAVSSQNMPTLYFGQRENLTPEEAAAPSGRMAESPDSVLSIVTDVLSKERYKAAGVKDGQIRFVKGANECVFVSGGGTVSLSCFDHDDIVAAGLVSEPFYNALISKKPELQQKQVVMGPLVIKSTNGEGVIGSSHEAGHDLAEAVIEVDGNKSLALFYNKFNGPWQFVTMAGDEYGFSCQDMKADPDARKALYNQVCLAEGGQVRLDTNSPALQ